MRARLLVLVILISLAACAPEDGDTSTTDGDTSTTASEQGPTCSYLRDFVAVSAEDAPQVSGLTEASAEEVINETAATDQGTPDNLTEVSDAISQFVRFFRTDGEDPLAVSEGLRAEGTDPNNPVQASPIHALGFVGHIKFQPGTDPVVQAGLTLPDVSAPLDPELIAVVDSGIASPGDGQDPEWFYGAHESDLNEPFVIYEDPADIEDLSNMPASHGTFVSGLIRQIAPSKQVTFAAARQVATDLIMNAGEDLPAGNPPTSEIHVAEAIARLIIRHQADSKVMKALNLSLGAYTCDPTQDVDLVTMNAMIQAWLTTFQADGPLVMAAAGNEMYPASASAANQLIPLFPAGLNLWGMSDVHGVAALDQSGEQVVWDNNSRVAMPFDRPWATDTAPGADLINLSGNYSGGPELVCWSGSSFATAVASAQMANGTTVATSHNNVDGLTFVEASGDEVVTVGGTTAPASASCNPTTVTTTTEP